jgi:hypothetical protein
MKPYGHSRHHRLSAVVGGAVAASLLTVGVAAGPAGAGTLRVASQSAFCHTILTYHPTQPKGTSYTSYQKWAKTYLPFWTKLASEAPSGAAKTTLNELVTIIKYEANAKTASAVGAYLAVHQKQWINGWKAVTKAILNCATSLY